MSAPTVRSIDPCANDGSILHAFTSKDHLNFNVLAVRIQGRGEGVRVNPNIVRIVMHIGIYGRSLSSGYLSHGCHRASCRALLRAVTVCSQAFRYSVAVVLNCAFDAFSN